MNRLFVGLFASLFWFDGVAAQQGPEFRQDQGRKAINVAFSADSCRSPLLAPTTSLRYSIDLCNVIAQIGRA